MWCRNITDFQQKSQRNQVYMPHPLCTMTLFLNNTLNTDFSTAFLIVTRTKTICCSSFLSDQLGPCVLSKFVNFSTWEKILIDHKLSQSIKFYVHSGSVTTFPENRHMCTKWTSNYNWDIAYYHVEKKGWTLFLC